MEDFDGSRDTAHFAVSSKGWSSDSLGLQWLQNVFERYTKDQASREWRLLIVDGHSSHLNMEFISYAEQHRILLAILPPHSTHRLQPLDIGLFSPLAHYYTQEIDKLLYESQGLTHITKRHFWRLFSVAWEKAFTPQNIDSAFRATGLKPWNPQRVIQRPIQSPSTSSPSTQTPKSLRSLRRQFKRLQAGDYLESPAFLLLRAAEKFATEKDILRHENNGLRNTIKDEKKKRKRGKPLGLMDNDDAPGQALFFSPAKINRARQRILERQEADHQQKQARAEQRLQKAITRSEREREKEERQTALAEQRAVAKVEKKRQQAEKRAERGRQQAQREANKAQRRREIEDRKEQRAQAKRAKEEATRSRKRQSESHGGGRATKRRCLNPLWELAEAPRQNPRNSPPRPAISIPKKAIGRHQSPPAIPGPSRQEEEAISRKSRRGRQVRLPTRYK
jgi:DDE superfamily endonuclease